MGNKCLVGVRGVIKKGNKFFLVQRKDNDKFGGQWEFPGGKADCQNPKTAIKREIKKETGLNSKKVKFIKQMKDGKYTVRYYKSEVTGKVKMQPSEVQDYGWFNKSQSKKLNLVSHTKNFL